MSSGTCVKLLPLCSIPKLATREGMTSATAYMNVVGLGIWYASGQQVDTSNARSVQDNSRTYVGTVKPDTYSKGFNCAKSGNCPA